MAAICDRIRGDGGIVCVVGTTALSVIHYERGRTAHSTFGIPVQQSDEGLQSRIKPGSAHAEVLRQATLVIWEEMPMASKVVWECVDQLLRNVMSNDLPFGGKPFVGLGDFRQVAPVIRDGSGPAATYANSIRSSDLWDRFEILRLTAPIRYAGDPAYADWVDRVGDGLPPYETTVDLGHLAHVDDLHAAANYLFMDDNLATSPDAVRRAFLSPFNERVDRFNDLMLDKVDGDHRTYHSHDTIKELDDASFHLPAGAESDILATMHEPGVPPADLKLKVGCIASIMRNLSIEDGLVKNARVQVTMPTFYLPRITFEFGPRNTNWTVKRRQFPLRLAYATTFNSCQGLTLDRVVLDLTKPVFAHGQLYTSLSRVRSGADVRILRSPDERGLPTSNVVYRVLLLPTEDGQTTMSIDEE
ncbi:PIF1-like helicase domain containing protein [Elaphomyces granulatus]